ncbi:MAG: DUF6789 family protein [Paracoccaceae bacterium]
MKPDLKKSIYGGIAGTAVMTMMTLWVAPAITGFPMDIAALLQTMVGSYGMGWIAHLMMGIIIFPVAYALVIYGFLPGSPVGRGLLFGGILWVLAAVMVMPLAGAGFLMSNIGGFLALMASLMGHLVYGGLLGYIAGGGEEEVAA